MCDEFANQSLCPSTHSQTNSLRYIFTFATRLAKQLVKQQETHLVQPAMLMSLAQRLAPTTAAALASESPQARWTAKPNANRSPPAEIASTQSA
jgi:hypothetical protein